MGLRFVFIRFTDLGKPVIIQRRYVGTIVDLGAWLKNLGLDQYEAAFRDNAIDADVLPSLTSDDLKDLGVTIVGHRRKLLDAITLLRAETGPAARVAQPPPTAATPRKSADLAAERRPVTVLFCDLVGSTALAAKLDAEDWRTLVSAYLDAASEAVAQYGGHVLKKLGDGLMALFGYPSAQENDAERAARASLAILAALETLNASNEGRGQPRLAARLGLDTGPVVVDGTGEVFGEAPNVAARAQSLAEPGQILITAAVQRQVAGLFVAEDKGAHELKGVPRPVALYRIVRASGGGRRGGARALTTFVGRDEDLTLLLRRFERARRGEGQFVQIVGEPGIGKSRLLDEFHARLAETPHTWVEWSASQLLQNTPLHPLAEWGRLRFGGPDVAPEKRLADLEQALGLVKLEAHENGALLAPLLDIPLPEARALKFAPEELRRRQLAAVAAWLLAGARSQALVLAIEDLHWADPTTLDLMKALAERGAGAPLFILATTRPEFRPPWTTRSHHGMVSLSPLDRGEIRKMVGAIAERHALTNEVVEGLSERTGGVPLFVEEVTRLLLEQGEKGGAQAIPPTLQQSLAARLDRLGHAREAAQIGAVLGREFSYRLLTAVAGLEESALQSALEKLADADLLFVEGHGVDATYRFKHALIQDAAYDSLLKSRRQALHRRAAEALHAAPDPLPEVVAHHFTQAGDDEAAIEWWGKAGDAALRRSAFQEAIAHLGKAIQMADKEAGEKAAGPSGDRKELHVAYGNALFAARGYGAPETAGAFARARELASSGNESPERLAADFGLWAGSHIRGELSAMRAYANAFLSDVEARPDSPEAGVAHRAAGITRWFAGEYREAREHLERALALFQPGRDDDLAFRFGHDAGASAMCFLAFTLWPLGDVKRALSLVRRAEARSAGLAHIGTRAFGKWQAALFDVLRADLARSAPSALELARLAREHDLPFWRAWGVFLEGLANVLSGAADDGLDEVRRGVAVLREQKILMFDGLVKITLAEVEARAGDVDGGLAIVDEALATSKRTGYRAFEAELHRVRGQMMLSRDPADSVRSEEALRTAIAIAKEQGARTYELLAALPLAKLLQSSGRAIEAHATLSGALDGFPSPLVGEDQGGGRAFPCRLAAPKAKTSKRSATPHPGPPPP
jgi:class 3 adenylate cyclase/tetratricopeptide (TPR) repeat protein